MTEKDLLLTWCPYARVPLSIVQNIRGMAGGATDVIGINRNVDGTVPPAARCIGRACSQFRRLKQMRWEAAEEKPAGDGWIKTQTGMWMIEINTDDVYCGRAGKP